MGYFSELAYEVVELTEQGLSPEDVALKLHLSVEDVEEVLNTFSVYVKDHKILVDQ